MNLPTRKSVAVAVVLFVVGASHSFVLAQDSQSFATHSAQVLQRLTAPPHTSGGAWASQGRLEDLDRFREVWAARNQRDISDGLIPFINYPPMDFESIHYLGRMESPQAQAPIEALLALKQPSPHRDSFYQIALGRIKSRGMEGQAKVESVMKEVGLTWADTVILSQKFNGKKANRAQMQLVEGDAVMDELSDLLHVMSKRGQDVKPLTKQLTLLRAQRAWIESADADNTKEARRVLNYLVGLYDIQREDYLLMHHLRDWNSAVADVSLSFLEDMKRNPKKYYAIVPFPGRPGSYLAHMGYSALITVAEETEDKRMLPYFRYFVNSKKLGPNGERVRSSAKRALESLTLHINASSQ